MTDTGVGMDLAPSMDIFSAGCVLIELFTDSPPFYFHNLLAYRAGEYSPDRVLDKIDDHDMKVCKFRAFEGPFSFALFLLYSLALGPYKAQGKYKQVVILRERSEQCCREQS